jgi:hypothetical protein
MREIEDEDTQVHFTKSTRWQSPDQESRTTPRDTKRHNAIMESTATVNALSP